MCPVSVNMRRGSIQFVTDFSVPYEDRNEKIQKTLKQIKKLTGEPLMFNGTEIGKCRGAELIISPEHSHFAIHIFFDLEIIDAREFLCLP